MTACKSPEEAYAIAQAAGVPNSLEEFVAAMEEIRTQASEISEEDLEGLNAGISSTGGLVLEITLAATAFV